MGHARVGCSLENASVLRSALHAHTIVLDHKLVYMWTLYSAPSIYYNQAVAITASNHVLFAVV